jgi:hypothetical protein
MVIPPVATFTYSGIISLSSSLPLLLHKSKLSHLPSLLISPTTEDSGLANCPAKYPEIAGIKVGLTVNGNRANIKIKKLVRMFLGLIKERIVKVIMKANKKSINI